VSDDFTELTSGELDSYWEQDKINDRDEYDLHVRHVEDEERERLNDHGA